VAAESVKSLAGRKDLLFLTNYEQSELDSLTGYNYSQPLGVMIVDYNGDPRNVNGGQAYFEPIIAGKPTAAFSFHPSVPKVGEEVHFTNTTTGAEPIEYLWDFGDSSTSTEKNPVHSYATAGVKEVTLTASNEFGSSTYSALITVEDLPTSPWLTVDITVEPDPVVLNQPATFYAVVTNITDDKTVEGVVASGVIPDFVTFVAASPECSVTEGVLTCNLGDLGPGETASAWVTVIFTDTGTFDFVLAAAGVGATPVTETASITVVSRIYAPILMRSQ
jgi:PKD repeat protein